MNYLSIDFQKGEKLKLDLEFRTAQIEQQSHQLDKKDAKLSLLNLERNAFRDELHFLNNLYR
jgi:hypothetical protein